MNKATKALRRSSIRLKSIGDSHGNLRMVISQLQDVRSSAKAFTQAQTTAAEDFVKWSSKNENQAIQDTFSLLFELNALWAEVQKEFTEHLKEFIHQFEKILESELHVDVGRSQLLAIEQREHHLEKELSHAVRRSNPTELMHLQTKLEEEKQAKQIAQQEVTARIQENEAVKLIRVKKGLLQLSESYLQFAQKCSTVFEAHHQIATQIPDAHNRNIHDIIYAGPAAGQQIIGRTRERLRQTPNNLSACAPLPDEPPPPYTAIQPPDERNMHSNYSLRGS